MPGGGSKPGERRGGRQKGTRNKSTSDVKALAQEHGPEAIRELARLAKNAESEQARVSAIKEILDRAYGKSTQPLSGDPNEPPIRQVLEIAWAGTNASG